MVNQRRATTTPTRTGTVWSRSPLRLAALGAGLSVAVTACSCGPNGLELTGGADDACGRSDNELVRAADEGDEAKVRQALRNGADPDSTDDAGNSALACAGPQGHTEVVDVLLDAGANPRTDARDGDTVVADAVLFCRQDVLDLLLDAGGGAGGATADGHPLLEVALRAGDAATVATLLDHGADPDSFRGDASQELFEVDGPENWPPSNCPDDPAARGTALLALLDAGAAPDRVLERSLRENHAEPTVAALVAGADPNGDPSPLVLAATWGNAEAIGQLLAAGADPNTGRLQVGSNSEAVLCGLRDETIEPSTALRCESVAYLKVLSDGVGASFTGQQWSVPPLVEAAGSGDVASVHLLLDAGADPNAAGQFGFTPLHAAAASGDLEVIDALVRRGAVRPATDALLPSELANRARRTEAAALLRYLGA